MIAANHDAEALRSVVRIMDEHRRKRGEQLRDALKAATVPLPAQLVQAIVQLTGHDARDILREHPGFQLWERRRSYASSLRIFERSVACFLDAINNFEEASRDGAIFEPTRSADLAEIEGVVERELFATANAVHALVDHSRRLRDIVGIANYNERRERCFGDDGLHDFVIALRTLLHHIQIIVPGWLIGREIGAAAHTATFKLDRDEVVCVIERQSQKKKPPFSQRQLSQVRRYLKNAPKRIDLRHVFEGYQQRAKNFHGWLSQTIEAQPLVEVRDYERCIQENKNFATRAWWRLMIGNWLQWAKPPNPYRHLERYLTSDQIAEVHRLPMGSDEQVDKIIEFGM